MDQLCWVACNYTLDRGRLVFPMEGGDQVAPPQVGQVNWVAWGYGCRWASLAGWPAPIRYSKEACVMDGGTGCQTHVGLAC